MLSFSLLLFAPTAQEALRPPTFVQKMLNSRALEGDTVRLECKVDASPPPQLFWKKDKDMLRLDPTRMRWVNHHFISLFIAYLQYCLAESIFVCLPLQLSAATV